MAVSKAGWILVLVGGVVGILGSLINILVISVFPEIYSGQGDFGQVFLGILYIIYFVVIAFGIALAIISLTLLRNNSKAKIGSIIALVLSILSLNILAIIGSILSLVKASE